MNRSIRSITIAAVVAGSLVAGAPAALAADGDSGASTDSTTTTVPAKSNRMTPEQRARYQAALKAYRAAEAVIKKTFVSAVKAANDARREAMKTATGKKAMRAIAKAYAEATKQAKAARDAALAALGAPPARPGN